MVDSRMAGGVEVLGVVGGFEPVEGARDLQLLFRLFFHPRLFEKFNF
jgi:hypothetical protein